MILFVKDIFLSRYVLFLQGRGLPEDDGGHAHQVRAHEEKARLHQGKAQAQKFEFFSCFFCLFYLAVFIFWKGHISNFCSVKSVNKDIRMGPKLCNKPLSFV
jgi:hypothetical protein